VVSGAVLVAVRGLVAQEAVCLHCFFYGRTPTEPLLCDIPPNPTVIPDTILVETSANFVRCFPQGSFYSSSLNILHSVTFHAFRSQNLNRTTNILQMKQTIETK
jgi:hypothetical protein